MKQINLYIAIIFTLAVLCFGVYVLMNQSNVSIHQQHCLCDTDNIQLTKAPVQESRKDLLISTKFSNRPKNKNYLKTLCELDEKRLAKLNGINFKSNNHDEIVDLFHQFIMDPTNMVCFSVQRFGGRYLPRCKYTDGAKFVCMDDLLNDITNKECLIYSFGIADDWSFEDVMDKLGCKVFAYDPSVSFPPRRGKNIVFTNFGVAAERDPPKRLDTLDSILENNNHRDTKISYLKVDIEGHELTALSDWLSTGALDNVQQIAIELHLTSVELTVKFFETLKRLYFRGSYRLISYDVNACNKNQIATTEATYYQLAEIVLMKVSEDYKINEGNCKKYS